MIQKLKELFFPKRLEPVPTQRQASTRLHGVISPKTTIFAENINKEFLAISPFMFSNCTH
jgi:hypothetical protein